MLNCFSFHHMNLNLMENAILPALASKKMVYIECWRKQHNTDLWIKKNNHKIYLYYMDANGETKKKQKLKYVTLTWKVNYERRYLQWLDLHLGTSASTYNSLNTLPWLTNFVEEAYQKKKKISDETMSKERFLCFHHKNCVGNAIKVTIGFLKRFRFYHIHIVYLYILLLLQHNTEWEKKKWTRFEKIHFVYRCSCVTQCFQLSMLLFQDFKHIVL